MFDPERSPISFDWPDRTAFPLIVPWPTRGNIGGMLEFRETSEWLAFLRQHDLRPAVPLIVAAKHQRAQKLYALAWLEFDLIKAGEPVALTGLESALRDRYGARAPKRGASAPQATSARSNPARRIPPARSPARPSSPRTAVWRRLPRSGNGRRSP